MSAADAMLPPRSVEEIRESLTVTEKGQTANTIGNCQTVFCQDPLLKGAICLNLLTDREDERKYAGAGGGQDYVCQSAERRQSR